MNEKKSNMKLGGKQTKKASGLKHKQEKRKTLGKKKEKKTMILARFEPAAGEYYGGFNIYSVHFGPVPGTSRAKKKGRNPNMNTKKQQKLARKRKGKEKPRDSNANGR